MHFLMFTGFRFYSGNFYHIHYTYQISLWGEFFEGDWGVVSCSNESYFGHIDGILLQMSLVKTLGSVLHQQSPLFLKPFPLLEPSFGQQSPLTQPFPLTSPYAVPRNPHLSEATSARSFSLSTVFKMLLLSWSFMESKWGLPEGVPSSTLVPRCPPFECHSLHLPKVHSDICRTSQFLSEYIL